MISSADPHHMICEHRLCDRIKEHLASFLNEPPEIEMEQRVPLVPEVFESIYDCFCFAGQFRQYVQRRINPEASFNEDYNEQLDDPRVQSNEFNQPIRVVYKERLESILEEEGFKQKERAIEDGRNYEGQGAIYAALLEDQEALRHELEHQKAAMLLLIADNENLKSEIEEIRANTASLMNEAEEFRSL